jgi:2-keto-3-deoxy-L-fuconate dehydrogenase
MGRAAALAFAREGAKVWATDMNAKTVGELDGKDGIRARALDVTDENAVNKLAAEAGAIDVLFNAPASCTTAPSSTRRRKTGTRRSPST